MLEQPVVLPLEIDTTLAGEGEAIEESGAASPQNFETVQVVLPQTLTPLLLDNQPPATTFQSPGIDHGFSMPPQGSESPQFVVPREIFPPPRPIQPVGNNPAIIPPRVAESPVIVPSLVVEPSQTVTPIQVIVSPMAAEPPLVTSSPVLGSSQVVTPHHVDISPMVTEPLLVTPPVLESQVVTPHQVTASCTESLLATPLAVEPPQAIIPHHTAASLTVIAPPSLAAPSPILGPQVVAPHQVVSSCTNTDSPLAAPPLVAESSRATAPHHVVTPPVVETPTVTLQPAIVSQQPTHQQRVTDPPPRAIPEPRTTVVLRTSGLTGGITSGNSGAVATTKSVYKIRDKASVTTSTRTRQDSIEGAPDIILSLSDSGYRRVVPSPQQGPLAAFMENNTNTSTTPSTLSPDDLIVPSSQPLEEYLRIPTETETSIPTTPSVDDLIVPSSQQSLEEPLTIPAEPGTTTKRGHFHFAPRVIPNYNIDRSDLPSWLLERGRLDYVLSVEAGHVWEKLVTTWLRQERRLGFGLNEQFVSEMFCHVLRHILMICRRERACP